MAVVVAAAISAAVATVKAAIITPIAIVKTTLRKRQFWEPMPSVLVLFARLQARDRRRSLQAPY